MITEQDRDPETYSQGTSQGEEVKYPSLAKSITLSHPIAAFHVQRPHTKLTVAMVEMWHHQEPFKTSPKVYESRIFEHRESTEKDCFWALGRRERGDTQVPSQLDRWFWFTANERSQLT